MSEAKDKAKELFDKYCYAIRTEETDSGYFTNIIYAKNCALIAVEQILENGFDFTDESEFWLEVKKELEKL